MSNNPIVSVLMLVYNLEKYAAQAIEGALMQETTFPVEIVIGEDCSTDRSKEVCLDFEQRFPDKIRVLRRSENLGLMANFADTLKNCRGKYVAFCDGDDYWTDPLKLQKQVDFLELNPGTAVCHHDFVTIDERGNIRSDLYPQKMDNDFDPQDMAAGAFMKSNTLLFRNKDITFPLESLKHSMRIVNNDTFLVCMLSSYGNARYLPGIEPSIYRVHNQSNFSSLKNLEKIESEIKTFTFVKNEVKREYRGAVNRKLFKLNYAKYLGLKTAGDKRGAIQQAVEMLFSHPVLFVRLFLKFKISTAREIMHVQSS